MPEPTRHEPSSSQTRRWGDESDPARRLWDLWRRGERPSVEDFVARTDLRDPGRIAAVLRVDQLERFRIGQWVRVETYLAAFPAVRDDPERAVDLIFAECLLREEGGELIEPEEYARRFPEHAEELRLQLELHRALETRLAPSSAGAGPGSTVGAGGPIEPDDGLAGFPIIPGYKLLGVLGRGGIGVVYRAWQKELNRQVALKMLHAGAQASPALQERFRVEAEAVARLGHPNIVQIHDLGQHAHSPYLVLELVEGGNLAQRIAGTPQPVAWSAGLVETLARATHAAHRQGVVHRDLTPANVLLTADDVPKITDFGLAKLIVGGDGLRTVTGDLLGTPSYMAPEQAAGRHREIGAATDVYALGAILYELLTGRPPFKAGSPLETLHQVEADEPVAPSRLRPRLPRDLETICLKCLRKEPARRYAGALELAEDLRRFLDNRPILARPVGPAERLWRRCRRNPVVAALVALVLGLTVALAVGSTVAAIHLKASRDEARLQNNRAEENFREARLAVEDSFTTISESALLDAPGLQPLRKRLLEGALKYYRGFVRRLGDRPEVRAELAAALDRLARITSEIGSKEEALDDHLKARDIYRALLEAHPGDAALRRALARSIAAVARLRGETSRREEAASEYRQALAIQRGLVEHDPADVAARADLADSETGLGLVLEPLGRREEALRCYERAMAIRERLTAADPDDPTIRSALALDYGRAGRLHREAGRLDEAIRSYERSVAIQEALVAAHPEVASYRFSLSFTYTSMGVVQRAVKRPDQTLASYQKAREALEALAAANPTVTDYRYELAGVLNNIANLQRASGRREEALRTHRRALEIREALVAADPRVVRYQRAMGGSYNAIAILQDELGRAEDSLRTFRQFRDRMQAVLADDPKNIDARVWLSSAWHNMGMVLRHLGRPAEAVSAYRQAIEQKSRVLAEGPRSRARLRDLGDHYLGLAEAQRALGRPAEAADTLWEQRGLWDDDPEGLYNLACGLALCIPPAGQDRADMTSEQRADRATYGDRAMDALRKAVAAGFRDLSSMRTDTDLAPLRTRDDFRALSGAPEIPDDPFAPAR